MVFTADQGYTDMPVTVPCGQCLGCRLEKSRQWATRLCHEAQLHTHVWFLTLTYDDEHLPRGGTLVKKHFQDFMKRLRKAAGVKLRYFHCGEYGDTDERPHYHAIVFGHSFPDRAFHTRNAQGQTIYKSEHLERTWGMGFCTLGEFSWDTAAYVARYILKKVTGEHAEGFYSKLDITTGEIIHRVPEYITMSQSIGIEWFNKFHKDIFPSDFVVHRGKKLSVPKFYDTQLGKLNAPLLALLKSRRKKRANKNKADNTHERLQVRAEIKERTIAVLKRKL